MTARIIYYVKPEPENIPGEVWCGNCGLSLNTEQRSIYWFRLFGVFCDIDCANQFMVRRQGKAF